MLIMFTYAYMFIDTYVIMLQSKNRNKKVNNNTENDNVIEQLLIKQKQEQVKISAMRNIIKNLEGKLWKNLPKTVCNELCNLALTTGKRFQQSRNSLKVEVDYKNIYILKSIKPDAWLSDRNLCLVNILQGVLELRDRV